LKAKKPLIIIVFSIILIFTTFSIYLIPIKAQTDLPPDPYFTSPSNDEFMSTLDPNIIKVYENQVEVRVVDLSDENDITHALFEFSFDGLDWFLIEEDYYNGFEGIQFNGDDGKDSTNGLGGTGWNTIWNTETLVEGYYFLRTTLFDQIAQQGTTEIMVHYDPTPPFLNLDQEPTINEGILGPLSGTVSFNASTMDEDPAYFILEYINASRPEIDQEGLGNANQENVGTPNTQGTPQTDDNINNFCGPTSAANALNGRTAGKRHENRPSQWHRHKRLHRRPKKIPKRPQPRRKLYCKTSYPKSWKPRTLVERCGTRIKTRRSCDSA